MSPRHAGLQVNPFLTAPVGRLFLSNALPMAVVMSMGGVLNGIDRIFVGHFIGSDALAAVSLSFPLAMMLSVLTTLTGGGMSSLMARYLGAEDRAVAGRIFAQAHGLALAISAGLVALWALVGPSIVDFMAAGTTGVAGMAQEYLRIMILGAPVQMLFGVHADALHNEGRVDLIAALSVLVNLFNIGANWLGIVARLMGFAFLPQMAIALAKQSIAGNSAGAGRNDRALATFRLAMGTAFLWRLSVVLIGRNVLRTAGATAFAMEGRG